MERLEQNNLEAQIKLNSDISSNKGLVIYYIAQEATKIINSLDNTTIEDDMYTMAKEDYHAIRTFIHRLRSEETMERLNDTIVRLMDDNKVKNELLKLLIK